MSDQLAGDIVKSLAELLKKRRAGRDAMVAAQLKRNNAIELAQNKAAKYWSPEAQAMVWGTAQEAAGMPTEQPWGEQRVDTVLPGAGGVGEATWSMKNEDLPTTGYQTGKTTVDPTQVFQEYVDEFGNTRDLPYADKLKIYNEGGQLGDKGLLVAPPKKDVKTDPISGQQFYSNEYTGRGDQVVPNTQTVENIYNQTGMSPEDILKDYQLNVPIAGKQKTAFDLEESKKIDYGKSLDVLNNKNELIKAFQVNNTFVDQDGNIIPNARPKPDKATTPSYKFQTWNDNQTGESIIAQFNPQTNTTHRTDTGEQIDKSRFTMVSDSASKDVSSKGLFENASDEKWFYKVLTQESQFLGISDPLAEGDLWATANWAGDKNGFSPVGEKLNTAFPSLVNLTTIKKANASPEYRKKLEGSVIKKALNLQEGEWKLYQKYRDDINNRGYKLTGTKKSDPNYDANGMIIWSTGN